MFCNSYPILVRTDPEASQADLNNDHLKQLNVRKQNVNPEQNWSDPTKWAWAGVHVCVHEHEVLSKQTFVVSRPVILSCVVYGWIDQWANWIFCYWLITCKETNRHYMFDTWFDTDTSYQSEQIYVLKLIWIFVQFMHGQYTS